MTRTTQSKIENSTQDKVQDVARFLFDDQEIRVFEEEGKVWIVADDLATVLGYSKADRLTLVLDDDEKGARTVSTLGGPQELLTVSESGCYHAIFKSRKPGAKKFRRWITEQVIPEIRRTGAYNSHPHTETGEPILVEKAREVVRQLNLIETEIVTIRQVAENIIETSLESSVKTGLARPQPGEETEKFVFRLLRSANRLRKFYESLVETTDRWEGFYRQLPRHDN